MNFLQKKLFELRDEDYKNFSAKLLPTVDKNDSKSRRQSSHFF